MALNDGEAQHKVSVCGTFPLPDGRGSVSLCLENPDGIICFQDENNEKHFYYANKKEGTIKLIDKYTVCEEDREEFELFKASFDTMENNSGRCY